MPEYGPGETLSGGFRMSKDETSPIETQWCVYVLRCHDRSFYTGITNKLKARLAAHAAGKGSRYVKARRPFGVARVIECRDEHEARSLEHKLKQLTRGQKIELMNLREETPRAHDAETLEANLMAEAVISSIQAMLRMKTAGLKAPSESAEFAREDRGRDGRR